MDDLKTWLTGRKTYIIAVAMVFLGLLQGLEIFVLPEEVWYVIGGAGLASLRAGVNAVSESVKKKKWRP